MTSLWLDQRTNIVIFSASAPCEWLNFFSKESRSFARTGALGIYRKERQSGLFLCLFLLGFIDSPESCRERHGNLSAIWRIMLHVNTSVWRKAWKLLLILIQFARLNHFLRQVRIVFVSKSVHGCVFSPHPSLLFPAPTLTACWVTFQSPILHVLKALVLFPSFPAGSIQCPGQDVLPARAH